MARVIQLLRSQSRQLSSTKFLSGYNSCRYGTWTLTRYATPRLNTIFQCAAVQKRWASTASDNKISIGPREDKKVEEKEDSDLAYEGPISSTIKKVKLLSLSTCCLSVSLGPVITFMTSPEMNVILKGAIASSVIFFSASTTGILHWFASPYIHKLRWKPGSDEVEVEMMSWLATLFPETIKFSDIRPAETNRPFVTFKANGKFYFIDEDHCRNKALLARLTPRPPPKTAFKNL